MTVRRFAAATALSLLTLGSVAVGAAPASADTAWERTTGTSGLQDTAWE